MTFTLFFFNDTATTEIYTLSLHDALPIWKASAAWVRRWNCKRSPNSMSRSQANEPSDWTANSRRRSEEHTSELQSRQYLVCRLLLEKKNNAVRGSWCARECAVRHRTSIFS